jgi:hypothetical protein
MLAIRPKFSSRAANRPQNGFLPPQYYLPISGVSINFGKNNALTIPVQDNVSTYACYQLARKNGLQMTYAQYCGESAQNLYPANSTLTSASPNPLSGGFMIIRPQDLQYTLDPSTAPGSIPGANNCVLSGTVNYYASNLPANNTTGEVELVIFIVYNQLFNEVSPGNYEIRAYNSAEGETITLDSVLTDPRSLESRAASYGGSFFSNLKSAAKKGLDLAVKNSDKIFNAAKSVLPAKYSGAIDKIEKYSDKLKNLYEKSGSGLGSIGSSSGYEQDKQQMLINIVMQMEEDGVPDYEIDKLVQKYTQARPEPSRTEYHGEGIAVDRKKLIDSSTETVKSRIRQFLS